MELSGVLAGDGVGCHLGALLGGSGFEGEVSSFDRGHERREVAVADDR
jgi:hypothetical protein